MRASMFQAYARRLTVVVALGLAACSIPQPFQPETVPALTLPGIRTDLVIESFNGTADGPAFAGALADALQNEDVAATTDEIAGPAFRMFGRAVPKAGSVELQWGIEDARGMEVGSGEHLLSADQAVLWRAGDAAFYRGLARSLASEAAASLAETRAGSKEDFTVVVPAVTGAPGDGARTLQQSMIYVLEKRGVKVSHTGDAPPNGTRALTLRGMMTVTPVSGHSHVDMAWSLLRDDGSEVGKVQQVNDVPPAMLSGQWGDVAFAIADSAADSVINLVDRAAAAPQPQSANEPAKQP
jgi:hypothetical protein